MKDWDLWRSRVTVPYAESKNMAAKLAQAGAEYEFVTVTGAGLGLGGAKPGEVARIADWAAEFIQAHTS